MLTLKQALEKLQRYCAYQERCHTEVRKKLHDLGVYGDDAEEVIVCLIEENYLNELRYSELFVRSKFNQKRWGKQKITQQLKQKQISAYCIKKGLAQIEEPAYREALYQTLLKKARMMHIENPDYAARQKMVRYAVTRGYELGLAWEVLNAHWPTSV